MRGLMSSVSWILPAVMLLLLGGHNRGAAAEIVCLGDSLTAGYGVADAEAWPSLVATAVAEHGWTVHNAGVSGDTSGGALSRLQQVLDRSPQIVIVAIGANDGLRGFPIREIHNRIEQIVRACQATGARVLLAGMQVPPQYGRRYADGFAGIYPAISEATGARLHPFLLADVAGVAALNQADQIHPTAAGHAIIAERILPSLRPLLGQSSAGGEDAR